MDFLIPLSDSKWHLTEVLLQQPEKMVSTEEVLKRMEKQAKKKRKAKPSSIPMNSPISRLLGCGEKRREENLSRALDQLGNRGDY